MCGRSSAMGRTQSSASKLATLTIGPGVPEVRRRCFGHELEDATVDDELEGVGVAVKESGVAVGVLNSWGASGVAGAWRVAHGC